MGERNGGFEKASAKNAGKKIKVFHRRDRRDRRDFFITDCTDSFDKLRTDNTDFILALC